METLEEAIRKMTFEPTRELNLECLECTEYLLDRTNVQNLGILKPLIIIDSEDPSHMEIVGSICAGRNTKGGCYILFASLEV